MKQSDQNVKLPITLLPVNHFQRELLAGLSGALIWFVATFWPFTSDAVWWNGYNGVGLLDSFAKHLDNSSGDVIRDIIGYQSMLGQVVSRTISILLDMFPTIVSIALAAASVVMLLSAFKIVSFPARLRWCGPAVLGAVILFMLFVAIVIPPFSAITSVAFPFDNSNPPDFSLNVGSWWDLIIEVVTQLVVPAATVALGLVPIFAPAKKSR